MESAQEFLNVLKNRRTIGSQHYNDEPVTEEEFNMILEAGNWAPTHGTTQPWRYIIYSTPDSIQSYLNFLENWYEERCDTLSEEATASFRRKYGVVADSWPYQVKYMAVIAMKRYAKPDKKMPEWEETCAVAMSVQNMQLMAAKLNIGSFWSSHTWAKYCRDSPEFKKYLNLEEEDKIMGALVFGKYDSDKTFKSARTPMETKIQRR